MVLITHLQILQIKQLTQIHYQIVQYTLGSSTLALGASTTAIAGVTQLDVDNVRI
jgi:hypothetical protein